MLVNVPSLSIDAMRGFDMARLASGEIRHGVTDSQGLTARHETSDAQSIHIYIGHKQEA